MAIALVVTQTGSTKPCTSPAGQMYLSSLVHHRAYAVPVSHDVIICRFVSAYFNMMVQCIDRGFQHLLHQTLYYAI